MPSGPDWFDRLQEPPQPVPHPQVSLRPELTGGAVVCTEGRGHVQ